MFRVPGDFPSQMAIRASAYLAILPLRKCPAEGPIVLHSQSSTYFLARIKPFTIAYSSPSMSIPGAPPLTISVGSAFQCCLNVRTPSSTYSIFPSPRLPAMITRMPGAFGPG